MLESLAFLFILNKLFSFNKIEAGGNLGICVSKLPSLNVLLHILVSVRYVRPADVFSLLWSCQEEAGCQRKIVFLLQSCQKLSDICDENYLHMNSGICSVFYMLGAKYRIFPLNCFQSQVWG